MESHCIMYNNINKLSDIYGKQSHKWEQFQLQVLFVQILYLLQIEWKPLRNSRVTWYVFRILPLCPMAVEFSPLNADWSLEIN